jgi:hypothetical protein
MELGGWRLRVLHPAAGGERSGNESSLVLSVTHRAPPARTRVSRAERTPPAEVARTVLLTGDIGSATEARLPAAEIAAAALKIGHHGSRYSSDGAFLDRVAPRLALISAGEGNAYGHPAADVLERLAERGVAVWRTDRGGQIRLRFGEVVEVDQPWAREPTSSPPIELPYNAAQAARGCRSSPSWVPPPAARPPWPCGWPSRWISRW